MSINYEYGGLVYRNDNNDAEDMQTLRKYCDEYKTADRMLALNFETDDIPEFFYEYLNKNKTHGNIVLKDNMYKKLNLRKFKNKEFYFYNASSIYKLAPDSSKSFSFLKGTELPDFSELGIEKIKGVQFPYIDESGIRQYIIITENKVIEDSRNIRYGVNRDIIINFVDIYKSNLSSTVAEVPNDLDNLDIRLTADGVRYRTPDRRELRVVKQNFYDNRENMKLIPVDSHKSNQVKLLSTIRVNSMKMIDMRDFYDLKMFVPSDIEILPDKSFDAVDTVIVMLNSKEVRLYFSSNGRHIDIRSEDDVNDIMLDNGIGFATNTLIPRLLSLKVKKLDRKTQESLELKMMNKDGKYVTPKFNIGEYVFRKDGNGKIKIDLKKKDNKLKIKIQSN